MSNRDVPAKYKAMYKRAMTGKSRKAAMSVFCAECVGYVSSEIGLCSDKGCHCTHTGKLTQIRTI